MRIDEAIEILKLELHSAVTLSTHRSKDAVKLGIEALKCVERLRDKSHNYRIGLLPGETEK